MVINALDLPANLAPIKVGQDGSAGISSQSGGKRTVLQKGYNPFPKRFIVMIRNDESVVQMAHTLGAALGTSVTDFRFDPVGMQTWRVYK